MLLSVSVTSQAASLELRGELRDHLPLAGRGGGRALARAASTRPRVVVRAEQVERRRLQARYDVWRRYASSVLLGRGNVLHVKNEH